MTTVLRDEVVHAAKPHQCSICRSGIAKGEAHTAQTLVDGGDIWTARSHHECLASLDEFARWLGWDNARDLEEADGTLRIDDAEFRRFLTERKADS